MTTPRQDEIDRLAREWQADEEEKKAQAERLAKTKQKKTNVLPFMVGAAAGTRSSSRSKARSPTRTI
ncbi:MAG: hypothetical protein WBE89_18530 [Methyloceanibacter sp.]